MPPKRRRAGPPLIRRPRLPRANLWPSRVGKERPEVVLGQPQRVQVQWLAAPARPERVDAGGRGAAAAFGLGAERILRCAPASAAAKQETAAMGAGCRGFVGRHRQVITPENAQHQNIEECATVELQKPRPLKLQHGRAASHRPAKAFGCAPRPQQSSAHRSNRIGRKGDSGPTHQHLAPRGAATPHHALHVATKSFPVTAQGFLRGLPRNWLARIGLTEAAHLGKAVSDAIDHVSDHADDLGHAVTTATSRARRRQPRLRSSSIHRWRRVRSFAYER